MDTTKISEIVGQLMMIGFSGTEPSESIKSFIKSKNIGGVIYFRHNVESPEQLAGLSNQLQALAPSPLFISIDQEGGLINRLGEPFTQFPSAQQLGEKATPKIVFDYMQVMAKELRAVGINWNFAPVCDVNSNPSNPIIGGLGRSFGSDPENVSKLSSGALRGLQKGGIIACAKHFPGHGDTASDSHQTLPVIEHDKERLEKIELPPFKRAIKSGVESVMTAHILYTALDDAYPATLSKKILHDVLRKECRFGGVVVSDDMNMKGITDHYPLEQAIPLAINAGVDLILYCLDFETQQRAHETLIKAVKDREISILRINESVERLNKLRKNYIGEAYTPVDIKAAKSIIGSDEHKKIISIKPNLKQAVGS